jgi:hypothetical protein
MDCGFPFSITVTVMDEVLELSTIASCASLRDRNVG